MNNISIAAIIVLISGCVGASEQPLQGRNSGAAPATSAALNRAGETDPTLATQAPPLTPCADHGIPLLPNEKPVACRTRDDAAYPMTPIAELTLNPHKWKTYLRDQTGAIFVYNGPSTTVRPITSWARPFVHMPPVFTPAVEGFACATGPSADLANINDFETSEPAILYSISWSLAGGTPGAPAYMSNDGSMSTVGGNLGGHCQNFGGQLVPLLPSLEGCRTNYLPGVVALLVETDACSPAYIAELYAKLDQLNHQLDLLVQCEWSTYIQRSNLRALLTAGQISYDEYNAQVAQLTAQMNQCREDMYPLAAQQQALISNQFVLECGITPVLP